MKKCVLHDMFEQMDNVRMTKFGEFELPLHFSAGILQEHRAVREHAGLFDVSHMGRIRISGESACEYLDYLLTNDVRKMIDGQLIYSLMCYPDGTVVDDVILYRLDGKTFFMVLNSSNIEKDISWITLDNPHHEEAGLITVENLSESTSQFALQGPQSASILDTLGVDTSSIHRFSSLGSVSVSGVNVMISRNGYTGEDGFELYVDNKDAHHLYLSLLEAGRAFSLLPCGLGARDTLRLEARLPLYGHELSDEITPYEANLGIFVKTETTDFCGRTALLSQKEKGIERSLRGFEMIDQSVPRAGYKVFLQEELIGKVTSGMKSPTLGIFCGLMLITRSSNLKFNDSVEIEIHGKRKRAKVVKTPFYRRGGS
ncbi:MAG: glycine cleavage system aminomethyltransferase GcvT [Sphaerochaetaceae bacterium]|nr:glycine cleavage system aminomethyltransferase GcvT [Sphaerochaetaceae bacterium]